MPRVRLNGIECHYQQVGNGPDVVLVHAFTGNLSVWMLTGIADALSADFRVTAYDLRGHGLSSVSDSGYTSAELAADLLRLHEKLQLDRVFLVGHSYGGVIAAHAAVLHPEIVRGIVLSDVYFPGLRHLEPDMGQAGPWTDLRETILELDIDLGPTVDFGRLFRTVADFTPGQLDALREKMGAAGARWLSHMGQLAETTAGSEMFEVAGLTEERICTIEQPVVALYDEFSPFQATCQYLERHLANCTFDVVPDARHLAPAQNPQAFIRLVQQHLLRLCDS